MVTQSSVFAWKIPWTKALVACSPWGRKKVGHELATEQEEEQFFKIHFRINLSKYFLKCKILK